MKQSSSHVWLTTGMDQLRAFVALFPEMLPDQNDAISEVIGRQHFGKDVLCRYENGIFPGHTRRKSRTHKSNEFFEVIASVSGIVRHSDLLYRAINDVICTGRPTTRTWEENPSMGSLGMVMK